MPQVRRGNRALDEYGSWGTTTIGGKIWHWSAVWESVLRWGIPWCRVEPERGRFDWRWIDQALPYLVRDLGVNPMSISCITAVPPGWSADSRTNFIQRR